MTNTPDDGHALRDALLREYRNGQGAISSGSVYRQIEGMWPYYEVNYAPHIVGLGGNADVLEIGCGPGNLLAWLRSRGLSNIHGVDASPGDVDFANSHLGPDTVECGDAISYLETHPNGYDLIVAKALVEHLPKDRLLRMVRALGVALRDRATVLIDVPNMDWLVASHERYMDLTHEVGFTRESLAALMRLGFEECEIAGSRIAIETRSQRVFRPLLLWLVRRALYVLGEGANDTLFASRSLIAVARTPRRS